MKTTIGTSTTPASLEDARVLLATGGVRHVSLCVWGPDAHARDLFLTLVFDPDARGAVRCRAVLPGCTYKLSSSSASKMIPVRVEHHDDGDTHVRLRVLATDGQSIDHTAVTAVEINHPALQAPLHVALLTLK